jgi:serine phosphatase RsbU (regulator of sigma subunit)/putative methionine-R-sulfoxide reductase with GAF domain
MKVHSMSVIVNSMRKALLSVMSSVPQDRLLLLFDLIGRFNSKMDLNTLLMSIMEAAKTMMDAEASSLFVLDDATGELVINISTGEASARIGGFRIPKSQGIAGWVATKEQPLLVPDVTKDARFGGDVPGSGFVTRDLLCVPMKNAQGKLIGVLQAINHVGGGTFPDSEIALFQRLADQAAIAIDRERLIREFVEKRKMEQQLNLARDIQTQLWPRSTPELPGYSLFGNSIPAFEVGGDYYDFIPLKDGRVALLMCDVSGKGVGAALIMASLRATLRTQLSQNPDVDLAIQVVNEALFNDTRSTEFVTIFMGVLCPVTHQFTYVNAGHNPPYMRDADGYITELVPGGPVAGIAHPIDYISNTITIQTGSLLMMFTDGVTEAENMDGEMYDETRLVDFLHANRMLPLEELHANLIAEVDAFQEGMPHSDDITVLILRREV